MAFIVVGTITCAPSSAIFSAKIKFAEWARMHPSIWPFCMSISVTVSLAAAIRQIICIAILAAEPYLPFKYSWSVSVRLRPVGLMMLSS